VSPSGWSFNEGSAAHSLSAGPVAQSATIGRTLHALRRRFRFRVDSKNGASSGYLLALDTIKLTKL
jgi:hypothetical protein